MANTSSESKTPTKAELEADLAEAHKRIAQLEQKAKAPKLRRLTHTEMETLKRADGDLSVILKDK
jgi:hypothetical protein